MKNRSLVSVIIPTHGGANYLNKAIDSFIYQTYKNIEIIVVDDNGIDTELQKQTQTVVEPYMNNSNFHYICHEKNKNGSAARNTGVKNSIGNYLIFFDDDDVSVPERVQRQVELLDRISDDVGAVYCSHDTYYNGKRIEVINAVKSGRLLYDTLIHSIEIATSSLMIRRSCYDTLNGFDETFKRHQDWEFISRLSAKYEIYADDFIGYHRILSMRFVPKDPQLLKEYRMHYLEKMKPYIRMLDRSNQKRIVVYNRMDVALQFFKHKKYREFISEVRDINGGIYLLSFLFKRMLTITKRKQIKMI